MKEEIILDLAELIQDYFAWVEANPDEASNLAMVYEPAGARLLKAHVSDLLGFSRWLAQNLHQSPEAEQDKAA